MRHGSNATRANEVAGIEVTWTTSPLPPVGKVLIGEGHFLTLGMIIQAHIARLQFFSPICPPQPDHRQFPWVESMRGAP
jgi:hypothetical protein